MSAPMRRLKDIDPALMYAPPHVRREHGISLDENREASGFGEASDRHEPKHHEPQDLDAEAEFSADRTLTKFRRRLAPDPEWMSEPPPLADERNIWALMLRASGVLAFVTMAAWLVTSSPTVKLWLGGAAIGANSPGNGASASARPQPLHRGGQMHAAALLPRNDHAAATAGPPPVVEQPPIAEQARAEAAATGEDAIPVSAVAAITPPAAAAREAHPPADAANFVSRHIGRSELDAMLERAAGFIKSGDLSSARLLLRRAAEAGDVRAAFTLAGTFDPNVLKATGTPDGAPDLPQARLWYGRAAQLGSTDAARRLQQLATTSGQ